MPTPVEAVVVAVGFALAVAAVFAVMAVLCGARSDQAARLRPAARLVERGLTFPDRQLDAAREQHYAATDRYADMDTMARARMRRDRNLVETRPVAARRGRAA